jgi:hypothetical protein
MQLSRKLIRKADGPAAMHLNNHCHRRSKTINTSINKIALNTPRWCPLTLSNRSADSHLPGGDHRVGIVHPKHETSGPSLPKQHIPCSALLDWG